MPGFIRFSRPVLLAFALVGLCLVLTRPSTAASLGIPCSPGSDMSANDANCRNSFEADGRNPMPDAYLSIAMSGSMAVGAAWSHSQQEASNRAVADCNRRSSAPCKVAWSQLNACAAVAGSQAEKVAAIGALKGIGWNASGLAMSNCVRAGGHQCRVLVTACSSGIVSPRVWTPPRANAPAYQPPVLRLPRSP